MKAASIYLLLALLLAPPTRSWGAASALPLEGVQASRLVRLWLGHCASAEALDGRCLGLDLLLVQQREGQGPELLPRSYLVDSALAEHLAADLGEHAPLVLHQLERALRALAHPAPSPLEERPARSPPSPEEPGPLAISALTVIRPFLAYRVLSHVSITVPVELRVSQLARHFHRLTGERLVITSGTRPPEKQAAAMYTKLVLGGRYLRLYRKRDLALAIKLAFQAARRARQPRDGVIAAMAQTIQDQMARGLFVSPHLKAGAVDIRSRTMRAATKAAFRRAVQIFPDLRLIREEKLPPHFHLEVNRAGSAVEVGY